VWFCFSFKRRCVWFCFSFKRRCVWFITLDFVSGDIFFPRVLIYPNTFIQGQYVYNIKIFVVKLNLRDVVCGFVFLLRGVVCGFVFLLRGVVCGFVFLLRNLFI
jgi:hypothetical protein